VPESDGRIVGSNYLWEYDAHSRSSLSDHCRPVRQSKGAGRKLMEAADRAWEWKVKASAGAGSFNMASLRLYAGLGFT